MHWKVTDQWVPLMLESNWSSSASLSYGAGRLSYSTMEVSSLALFPYITQFKYSWTSNQIISTLIRLPIEGWYIRNYSCKKRAVKDKGKGNKEVREIMAWSLIEPSLVVGLARFIIAYSSLWFFNFIRCWTSSASAKTKISKTSQTVSSAKLLSSIQKCEDFLCQRGSLKTKLQNRSLFRSKREIPNAWRPCR